jgi:hypothetical protein
LFVFMKYEINGSTINTVTTDSTLTPPTAAAG